MSQGGQLYGTGNTRRMAEWIINSTMVTASGAAHDLSLRVHIGCIVGIHGSQG